ncbi:nitric oxide synthase oxygenase [Aquibacillus koreensis]|uniref:Nitric oxide synthase oxygenase n=1 Tax=Aquibacillus koreensis TaxID=279446 RepID=A0A9X4AJK4_9BACI|nr:nitric oxide synthase oxygenase [Aquibacillus koreensis]MCT2535272.1 nitric oxide synthase oxygenase [Aquibacillus koreensis]MDC3420520.1 nitric oxide synthase oxygenase [Aquibacillus koreensis]
MTSGNNTDRAKLMKEAENFLTNCYDELGYSMTELNSRVNQVNEEISSNGFYAHTTEELKHGAKMAWRNSNKCIGRLFWDRLHVIDARGTKEENAIFEQLFNHISFATNGGKIIPTITIFDPVIPGEDPIRIWNHQLLRYAGYETEQGVIGDPDSITFTKVCLELGWEGNGTAFDLLPLVIQVGNKQPMWKEIPEEIIMEVPIEHPTEPIFGDMEVKWYGVPIISDMRLEIGGIQYCAAPFNGWYMGTEVGARNFADENRYNLLPLVANNLNLDVQTNRSLWKDRALVELNLAVLYSYQQHGVTIVDHHTAAQQFLAFENKEIQSGRDVTGMWSWLIPPVSPATTHVFHKRYENKVITPNYYYQEKPFI